MRYLKIENVGVCPPEGFTLLGASTKRDCGEDVIGTKGSGNKHAIMTLMRHDINPIIYAGLLCLEFGTTDVDMGGKTFRRVFIKVTGEGKNYKEDQSWCLEYSEDAWTNIPMALREFISNAIDSSYMEGKNLDGCSVEVVEENQVRAKKGCTRVFVPYTDDVEEFHGRLRQWFMHFGETSNLEQRILLKAGRNFGRQQTAVVYRRGVRVREYRASEEDSIFDYNLDIPIDESRNLDDQNAKHEVGKVLRNAPANRLARIFRALEQGEKCWELTLDNYTLSQWGESDETRAKIAGEWKSAFQIACGERAVLVSCIELADKVAAKGYKPVVCKLENSGWFSVAANLGVPTDLSIVTKDERKGRVYSPATPVMTQVLDRIWDVIVKQGMTGDKPKPGCRAFYEPMKGESQTRGEYLHETQEVVIMTDGTESQGVLLYKVMVEELAHHCTSATDRSRDLQDWAFRLLAVLLRNL